MNPDLNCDLGEGESWHVTTGLLERVTSANVACGGHAGDGATMRRVLGEAQRRGVRVGAHPGISQEFGRGEVTIEPGELDALLQVQIRRLMRWAEEAGVGLTHVKLHGSLYHAVNRDRVLAWTTLKRVQAEVVDAVMFAPPEGWISRQAAAIGVEVWAEGFADRGYQDDGLLVPRGEPGALLTDAAAVAARIRHWRRTGAIESIGGHQVTLPVRTWCVHGDTPGSPRLAAVVRSALDE